MDERSNDSLVDPADFRTSSSLGDGTGSRSPSKTWPEPEMRALWVIVILITVFRCLFYLTVALPVWVLFGAFVPSLSLAQLTIVAVAVGWRIENGKGGWGKIFFRSIWLVGIELLFLAFMLAEMYFGNPDSISITELFYLFLVIAPISAVLLHVLPVILLLSWFRCKGFEIVNVTLPEVPRERKNWQFRIRDLLFVTVAASLAFAPLRSMNGTILWEMVLGIYSWPVLGFALGSLVIVASVAFGSYYVSENRSGQSAVPVIACVTVSILEALLCVPVDFLSFASIGFLFVNGIYAAVLQAAWYYMETHDWRIVWREDRRVG